MRRVTDQFERHVQPYWLRHIVVAGLLMVVGFATGCLLFGRAFGFGLAFAASAGAYLLHELHDYFILGKRGPDGGFDWLGLFAPVAASGTVYWLLTILFL